MCKKTLQACRTHEDFCAYAKKHGARIENGGVHTKIYGPGGGMVPVPRHPGEIGKGLRFSIIKKMALIGLLLAPLTCLISALIS